LDRYYTGSGDPDPGTPKSPPPPKKKGKMKTFLKSSLLGWRLFEKDIGSRIGYMTAFNPNFSFFIKKLGLNLVTNSATASIQIRMKCPDPKH
jgi:hypothetical protein